MSFWSSSYTSSAQQEHFETIEKANELKILKQSVEDFVKSLTARLSTSVWNLQNFQINSSLRKCVQIFDLQIGEEEFFANNIVILHFDDCKNLVLKRIVETFFDDRFHSMMRSHLFCIEIYFSSDENSFQFTVNQQKTNCLSLVFKENEIERQQKYNHIAVDKRLDAKSKLWRLLKKKN